MRSEQEAFKDFEATIRAQRANKPGDDEILETVRGLPIEYMVEYLGFLKHKYSIKPNQAVARAVFNKLEIEDKDFIETFSTDLDSQSLEQILNLVFAKSDRLLENYLYTPFPCKMINEYALLKARKINHKYKGRFRNALELVKMGIELNKGQTPEELFTRFKTMKKEYYESGYPPVDINTFFKLVIPILKRCSVRRGPNGFYDLRERIIQELKDDGLTPDQLSIDILDRRCKDRIAPLNVNAYKNSGLF